MVEKIATIRNPLTIIAIFAGIAEISGTIVLPFIALENQSIYVWFLILFPLFLVSVFFLTLNFNHRVLYAPSDYRNEDNFLKWFAPATQIEKERKLESEISELEEGETQPENTGTLGEASPEYTIVADRNGEKVATFEDKKILFTRTEDQILSSIEAVYRIGGFREVRFANTEHIFDGALFRNDMLVLVEIKMLTYIFTLSRLQKLMHRIDTAIANMNRDKYPRIHLILAFAVHGRGSLSQEVKAQIEIYQTQKSYSVEYKLFDFNPNENQN